MEEFKIRKTGEVGSGTRRLAVATVCVTAAATFTTAGGFLLTIPLLLGVIADSRSPRQGRWLMCLGAAYLSVTLLPMEILIVPEFVAELHSYHRLGGLGAFVFPLSIISILLIVGCDVALAIDAVRTKLRGTLRKTSSSVPVNLLIWITAFCFSVYSFWGIPFLVRAFDRGFAHPDVFLPGLAIILIAIVFDTALISDATKMWRKQRTGAKGAAPSSR